MNSNVPMYGFGGGGGTGAALTVTAPAGATVTVSKDGKTKTKTAGTDGVAVFKGLATGTWTVTITDGEQEAQKTVAVTADYSTEITFFSATIHVTYPAGSVCTATDGVTTLTAPDTSGTWECVVPNAGTWRVSLNGGFSETVTISNIGETQTINKWYLYKAGDQCTTVTNGWKANNAKMVFSFNSNYIGMNYSGTSERWANLHTKNKINMAGWSKVNIDAEITSNGQEFWYGVSSNLPESSNSKPSDVLAYGNKDSGVTMKRSVLSLDVSSVNTSAYVCFVAYVISGKIYNVWLS